MRQPRDHGGNLDQARERFGEGAWIDLSTGINPVPFHVHDLPSAAWTRLPTTSDTAELEAAARRAYGALAPIVALPGAQAAIQLVPRLRRPRQARVWGPTYNEHAGALAGQGWSVEVVDRAEDLEGSEIAVIVNPNNPDGRVLSAQSVLELAEKVELLVVDESFCDPLPDVSVAGRIGPQTSNVIVLRSFGKFYGLAGLRLGFAISGQDIVTELRSLAGPWAVGGPAIAVGSRALLDREWSAATMARLDADCTRLDDLACRAGWRLVGGTPLFRTYETPHAKDVQESLARAHIWTRIFPYSATWVRLGLPGTPTAWERLTRSLSQNKGTG